MAQYGDGSDKVRVLEDWILRAVAGWSGAHPKWEILSLVLIFGSFDLYLI